jgi:hypothetical protein
VRFRKRQRAFIEMPEPAEMHVQNAVLRKDVEQMLADRVDRAYPAAVDQRCDIVGTAVGGIGADRFTGEPFPRKTGVPCDLRTFRQLDARSATRDDVDDEQDQRDDEDEMDDAAKMEHRKPEEPKHDAHNDERPQQTGHYKIS